MSKRNTILILWAYLIVTIVVIQSGLAAYDFVFYGLIGLFILTQLFWLGFYLRTERQKELTRNLEQLFSDD